MRSPAQMSSLLSRFLPLLPAALLCLVAVVQVYLTRTQFLTPWKGGGFGMFSTTDFTTRVIRVWITTPEGTREIPQAYQESPAGVRTALRAVAHPSRRNMRKAAWSAASTQSAEGVDISRARITVSRTEYDVETLAPDLRPLRDRVFEGGGSERAP
ncbi:MAG: hypothetical protein ABR527_03315 [Gemmatimonadota bacterium]